MPGVRSGRQTGVTFTAGLERDLRARGTHDHHAARHLETVGIGPYDTMRPMAKLFESWLSKSILAGVAAMMLTLLALHLPSGRATIVLVAGVAAFIYTLRRSPALWYRRMASASLGAAAACLTVPYMHIAIKLAPGTLGSITLIGGPTAPVSLAALAGFFAWLDYRSRHAAPSSAEERGGDTTDNEQITSVDRQQFEDLAKTLIENERARHSTEIMQVGEEIGSLNAQLADALERARVAEQRGDASVAEEIIDAVRATGNLARLQTLLIEDRDRLKDDLIARNREIAAVAYVHGDIPVAVSALEEILRLRPEDLDAINRLGQVHFLLGQLKYAESIYRQVLKLSNDDATWQATAYGNLGILLRTRGDLEGAEAMHRKSLEIEEKLGRPEGVASAYGNLGIVLATRGDLEGAEAMYRKSLEEQLGRPEDMANAYGNLGIVLATRGDLEGAEAMFRESLAIDEKLGRLEGIANAYGNLGNVLQRRGDLKGAEAMHRKSLEID